jgi:phage terminase Nu1 subunit (DNA packaging protein)
MIDLKDKVSEKNLVLLTGLTQGRINQMKSNEIWQVDMSLDEASHAIVKWLGRRAAGHVSEDGLDLVQERAKLARENRETASLKNAEMRVSLVRVDEIRRSLFSAARSVRNSMQTISDRISMPVAGMTDHHDIHELIDKEVSEVLHSLDNDWSALLPEDDNEQDRDRDTLN